MDAFKFMRQVAVSDGQVESPCQRVTRGEYWEARTVVLSKGCTLSHIKEFNYYAVIGNGQT